MEINNKPQSSPQNQPASQFDQAKRRELKKQYMEGKQSAVRAKKTAKWIVAAVIIVILGGGVWLLSRTGGVDQESRAEALALSADDWHSGSKGAKAVLIEYGDFQCPACAAFYPIVSELKDQFSGEEFTVVYRHFPLTNIHPFALPAARAAEAAGRQGKFWEMHNLLFERQTQWLEIAAKTEAFESFALEIGLDLDRFRADLEDSDIDDKIRDQTRGGQRAGVDATPTFFLNGEKLANITSLELFISAIRDEINSNQ